MSSNVSLTRCHVCGREYHPRLGTCPRCKAEFDSKRISEDVSSAPQSPTQDFSLKQDFSGRAEMANFEELIRATNRTTRAVRAFVLFLFYQLTAITLSGILYLISISFPNDQNEPNLFWGILALVVWIGGVFISSNVGWREIRKSDF
jgi:hypothetical protein